MTLSTSKLFSLILMALLATSVVTASGLQIAGVYYDPAQAENGRIVNYPALNLAT